MIQRRNGDVVAIKSRNEEMERTVSNAWYGARRRENSTLHPSLSHTCHATSTYPLQPHLPYLTPHTSHLCYCSYLLFTYLDSLLFFSFPLQLILFFFFFFK